MRIEIVYATKTHHSQKIAEEIAAELKIEAKNVVHYPSLENVDLLFVVGGIYSKESLPEMINYIRTLDKHKVRKVALVTSCVSKKVPQEAVRIELMEKGIKIVDEFMCQGSFLLMGLGHPNKKDIEDAVAFAKETIRKQTPVS